MRRLGIVSVLLLSLMLAASCNPFGGQSKVTEGLVEVVRGDLTVTVSGSGNVEVVKDAKLAFGVGGRIEKIFVKEGDKVSQGDTLARLETDDLELALAEAKVGYTTAQVSVTQAAVAITQAEVALKNAEIALAQTEEKYTLKDIQAAQAEVNVARRDLDEALSTLIKYDQGTPGWAEYQAIIKQAQARLDRAEDVLNAMLFGFSPKEVAAKKQQVESARQSVELAQQSLELKCQSLELAQQSLKHAQKQLDKATITAPFDGIIGKVYSDEGDIIPPPSLGPTIIIYLIDASHMELKVEVDEMDVVGVKPGQRAIIELDALPDTKFEGKVSFVSPVPEPVSGVVTYEVKIDVEIPEGMGVRTGMSATADIVIAQRNNVLLVPDRAIQRDKDGNSTVEVMVNGQAEERPVITDVSDGLQTEIVAGLREGETVIEKRTTPKASSPGFF